MGAGPAPIPTTLPATISATNLSTVGIDLSLLKGHLFQGARRTWLVKPGRPFDEPLFCPGGQAQAVRLEPVPQEVEPAVGPTYRRHVDRISTPHGDVQGCRCSFLN